MPLTAPASRWSSLALAVAAALVAPCPARGQAAPAAGWPAKLEAPVAFPLFLSGRDWALLVDMRGFDVAGARMGERAEASFSGGDTGFTMSAFLEVMPDAEGAAACRTAFRARGDGPFKRVDERSSERDGMALHESTIEEFQGQHVHQRNVSAYLDIGDTCAEVHVSKTLYVKEDQARLDALISSIHVEKPFAPNAVDWLPFGFADECDAAMPALEAIERLEAGHHVLDRESWRLAVAQLAECRLQAKHADAAAGGLKAALREDADFAPLHYDLAAALASAGDGKGSLEQLRVAKAATDQAWPLPDPLDNPAFAPVASDATFRAGVMAMFGGPPTTAREERLPIAGEGALVLDVPGEWRVRRDPEHPGPDSGPTYELVGPRGRQEASLLITLAAASHGKDVPTTAAGLRTMIEAAGAAQTGAADDDGDLEIRTLPEGRSPGACMTVVDKALVGKEPPPDEWRVMTTCAVRAGGLLLLTTTFTQARDAPEIAQALAMLTGARQEPEAKTPKQ